MNKIFYKRVNEFTQMLENNGSIQKMYDALNKNDLSEAVMTALKILIESKTMLEVSVKKKSKNISDESRLQGNTAFKNEMYDQALKLFNLALLYAPKNSESMVLAYSNRSALLFQVRAMMPCLRDIDTCFSIGCSKDLGAKLLARKDKCRMFLTQLGLHLLPVTSSFGIEYFNFQEKRNKEIPCASVDVIAVRENGIPKIVAAKNIECGKIVCIEPAFVSDIYEDNIYISCYNCHKFTFNLHPCDYCCIALFCSDDCKEKCMKEYHRIECQIMSIIQMFTFTSRCRLPVKAALKIREMSTSWQEFISNSFDIGTCRMEKSPINEIYDVNNKSSILNFDDKMNFIQGKIFNQSFVYSVIIKYLSDIPGYFPSEENERTEAMRAMARIMLSLYVSFKLPLDVQNVAHNHSLHAVSTEPEPSVGFFSFASKLTHSCEPNLLHVGLNKKLALITTKFIKKGTELTISYLSPWLEVFYEDSRLSRLFLEAEIKCQCRVCVEQWSSFNVSNRNLTREQAQCIRKWRGMEMNMVQHDDRAKFRENCHALKVLQDIPHTREYYDVYREFRKKLTLFQYSATGNDIL